MAGTIEVKYSCFACGVRRQTVVVRARKKDEDVVTFFEEVVVRAVIRKHRAKYPKCSSKKLDEVMVPLGTDGRVGSEGKYEKPPGDGGNPPQEGAMP